MVWNPLNFAADYMNKMHDRSDALATSHKLGSEGWNSPRDAVRHTYTSAVLTKDTNSVISRMAGNANEIMHIGAILTDATERKDSVMDIYNNSIGRQIGQEAKKQGWDNDRIGQEVLKALDQGQLVTNRDNTEQSFSEPVWKH